MSKSRLKCNLASFQTKQLPITQYAKRQNNLPSPHRSSLAAIALKAGTSRGGGIALHRSFTAITGAPPYPKLVSSPPPMLTLLCALSPPTLTTAPLQLPRFQTKNLPKAILIAPRKKPLRLKRLPSWSTLRLPLMSNPLTIRDILIEKRLKQRETG